MKTFKIILNILGIILASLLSAALVALLIASPILTAVSSVTKSETVKEIVKNVNYTDILIGQDSEIGSMLEKTGIAKEAVNDILKTNAADKLIGLCTDEIVSALSGETEMNFFTELAVKSIVRQNIDEIANIAYGYVEDKSSVSIEELKTKILEAVDSKAGTLACDVAKFKTELVEEIDIEVIETVKLMKGTQFAVISWCVIAGASIIILLLRFPRFKGFMWVGSVFFVGTAAVGLIYFAFGAITDFVKEIIGGSNLPLGVITSITDLIKSRLGIHSLIYLIVAATATALFIIGRTYLSKRKKSGLTVTGNTDPAIICADGTDLHSSNNHTPDVSTDIDNTASVGNNCTTYKDSI